MRTRFHALCKMAGLLKAICRSSLFGLPFRSTRSVFTCSRSITRIEAISRTSRQFQVRSLSTEGQDESERTLFVWGLRQGYNATTDESLRDHFSSYGDVESARVATNESGRSRGFGFVTLKDKENVEKALGSSHSINDWQFFARKQNEKSSAELSSATVYVSNISKETTEDELREHFSQFGEIKGLRIPRVPRTKERKSFGFVEFHSREEARKAIQAPEHQIGSQSALSEVREATYLVENPKKVFVNRVPETMTIESLRNYCEKFGAVEYIDLVIRPAQAERETEELTTAFVTFIDETAAMTFSENPFHVINGSEVKARLSTKKYKPGNLSDYRNLQVSVEGLAIDAKGIDIEDYFNSMSIKPKVIGTQFGKNKIYFVSLWNLTDVEKILGRSVHVIGGRPVSIRRLGWSKYQEEALAMQSGGSDSDSSSSEEEK